MAEAYGAEIEGALGAVLEQVGCEGCTLSVLHGGHGGQR